tara:strand:+ start:210 stop:410 length:201 start_codon:yes stop_codon:yes gene_type:complete
VKTESCEGIQRRTVPPIRYRKSETEKGRCLSGNAPCSIFADKTLRLTRQPLVGDPLLMASETFYLS